MSNVRVRFAPSPTGELHIGGARTALFNLLYARATGGVFVLRIDDTDLERSRPEFTTGLLESLRWLGLDWDEGPYKQSEYLEGYRQEAERLIAEGKAYYCYCSEEELKAGREEARRRKKPYLYPEKCRDLTADRLKRFQQEGRKPVIRLKIPRDGETVVTDKIRGKVRFDNCNLDDFIIMKSNGLPTYNFANVIDDERMKITHVIRAEEHLSNTPRQQLCALALGYSLPYYAHVPMILAPDRSKLSKRHGATSVEQFRQEGYLPEALINYMTLLGWAPEGDREFFTMAEAAAQFRLDRVNKTAAVYDTAKLTWMNGHYLREGALDRIVALAIPFFEAEGLVNPPLNSEQMGYLEQVVELVRQREKNLLDLTRASSYFYNNHFDYDPKGVKKHFRREGAGQILRALAAKMKTLSDPEPSTFSNAYKEIAKELQLSIGKLMPLSRLALSGRTMGPELFDMMAVLGPEKVSARFLQAVAYIDAGS
ncbi:MAG: glutamate--tRNA ligase [Firmicutes bacterium]|nr:glutamate--tRNA ligase [Bacillota bacterium]